MGLELSARVVIIALGAGDAAHKRHLRQVGRVLALTLETPAQCARQLAVLALDALEDALAVALVQGVQPVQPVRDLDRRESGEEQHQEDVSERLHGGVGENSEAGTMRCASSIRVCANPGRTAMAGRVSTGPGRVTRAVVTASCFKPVDPSGWSVPGQPNRVRVAPSPRWATSVLNPPTGAPSTRG